MEKLKSFILISIISLIMSSCYTFTHTVGSGAEGTTSVKEAQWFALWGLLPIKEADSKAMAGDAENYTVKTSHTFGDQLISMFTGIISITKTTVEVKK